MVKSAYYSQLPTIRCRDCGELLDVSQRHRCRFAGGRGPHAINQPQQRQQQQRGRYEEAPYSPVDELTDSYYFNNSNNSPNNYNNNGRSPGGPDYSRGSPGGGGPANGQFAPRSVSKKGPRLDNIRTDRLDSRDQPRSARSGSARSPSSPYDTTPNGSRYPTDDVMSGLLDEMSMESNNNRAQAQQRSSGRKQCAGCRTEVHDSRQAFKIEALDNRVYHIQCFRCCVCEREFDNDNPFIPQDGLAFCEQDYQQSLRNICGGCGQSVFSRVVYALGKPWHEEHLKCSACFKPIRGNPFEHNNKVYCAADYKNLVAEKCRECDLPIEGETICALDSSFHKECFVCKTCKEPFADRNFYVYDDEPLCNIHFHEKNNSLCGACGDPIEGPCADIAETGRRFHTNCWACCVCRTPLVSVYYSHNGRPYCEHDIHELYRREKSQNQRAKKRQTLMMNL